MSRSITQEEVQKHNSEKDGVWIVIDNNVYDMSSFLDEHPGGKKILVRVAGKDASKQFWKYHNEGVLKKYSPKFKVGTLGAGGASDSKPAAEPKKELPPKPYAPPKPATSGPPKPKGLIATPSREAVAPMPAGDSGDDALEIFGGGRPFGEPTWYQRWHTPYYKDSHRRLRAEVREWVSTEIEPNCFEWDEKKEVPAEIYRQMGERGYLAGLLGIHYPTDYTSTRNKCVSPEEWDHFHELIVTDELSRCGSGGVVWNLIGGYGIGLPPLIKFGKESVKKRVVPDIIAGKKRICLCVTEPDAGSDVANLVTEAKKTEDGKHYIVNGEKKWITNGIWSDYFTVAVRTGGEGMKGVSLLLIEKTMPGVSVRRMDCQGVWASGTTYVNFEDVKVPVENLMGKENQGFKVIMTNFNHERLGIIIQANRFSRVCYDEALKYALKRKTFGKKLIDHPVIRAKLAEMAAKIEANHAWLENVVYQANNMNEMEFMLGLGGPIAGLKAITTKTFEYCAREATQIFGGLAYSRGGQGEKVERLYREVRAYSIPGGSEEIMIDLSMRQSLKVAEALGAKL